MNTKTFTSYIRNTKAFNLVIDGIIYVTSWFLTIRIPRVRISSVISLTTKFVKTVIIPNIKITIPASLVKLTQKISLTVSLKRIRIAITMKQLMKLPSTTLKVPKIFITNVTKEILRITSQNVLVPKIYLLATAIVAQYTTLAVFDPQTLGTLDTFMLQELDYTASP